MQLEELHRIPFCSWIDSQQLVYLMMGIIILGGREMLTGQQSFFV